MAVPALDNNRIGPDDVVGAFLATTAALTQAMATLDTGVAFRFLAIDSRDVKSVWINWSSIATPGTDSVQLRIETIDTTTGKPTGTLYDANAVKTFTPVAGWQQITFDVLPTTGLTPGTEYAVVIVTLVAGGTKTLRIAHSSTRTTAYPVAVLLGSSVTTRSNFAQQATYVPICTLVMDDDEEVRWGMSQYATINSFAVYGKRAFGMKLVLPVSVVARGVSMDYVVPVGSPSNLRARIYDTAGNLISGSTTWTLDKDSYNSSRRCCLPFAAPITISAGTYYILFDQVDHTSNSSNYWLCYSVQARTSGMTPSGLIRADMTDIEVWTTPTETNTEQTAIALMIDSIPAANGGSGGGPVVGGRLVN